MMIKDSDWEFHFGLERYVIPERMRGGLIRWIKQGIRPGDFLWAVLANDFVEAAGRADEQNMANLPAYANFLYNSAPRGCWGSYKKLAEWQNLFKESKNDRA